MTIRHQITVALTQGEAEILEALRVNGVRVIDVFRRGLSEYEKELAVKTIKK